MKIEVVFIKDHVVGLKAGTKRTFGFLHAVRLMEEGYVEPTDKAEFDAMAEKYDQQQKDMKLLIQKRIDDLKAVRDAEEEEMEEKKSKAHEAKRIRLSTDDIKKEEPKNPGKKAGKKDK